MWVANEFQIFANLDEERRHVSEICAFALYERRIKREAKLAIKSACATAPIAKHNVMPPYEGRAVTWKLIQYA